MNSKGKLVRVSKMVVFLLFYALLLLCDGIFSLSFKLSISTSKPDYSIWIPTFHNAQSYEKEFKTLSSMAAIEGKCVKLLYISRHAQAFHNVIQPMVNPFAYFFYYGRREWFPIPKEVPTSYYHKWFRPSMYQEKNNSRQSYFNILNESFNSYYYNGSDISHTAEDILKNENSVLVQRGIKMCKNNVKCVRMHDPLLTKTGLHQCEATAKKLKKQFPQPEFFVSSPLTRTISTTIHMWPHIFNNKKSIRHHLSSKFKSKSKSSTPPIYLHHLLREKFGMFTNTKFRNLTRIPTEFPDYTLNTTYVSLNSNSNSKYKIDPSWTPYWYETQSSMKHRSLQFLQWLFNSKETQQKKVISITSHGLFLEQFMTVMGISKLQDMNENHHGHDTSLFNNITKTHFNNAEVKKVWVKGPCSQTKLEKNKKKKYNYG